MTVERFKEIASKRYSGVRTVFQHGAFMMVEIASAPTIKIKPEHYHKGQPVSPGVFKTALQNS